ncbi:MAG: hypothetical protein JOZ90_16995 [Alphaproteobacteria bacterium]|nr:hypothetical protein [Alphaproteobacteria bacterium]MBV9371490.1 hypothetical protein [Alphaproteobacteria bacterium]MBV9902768.1 hypothetical protein [Alphaproteobacteria bacterium]
MADVDPNASHSSAGAAPRGGRRSRDPRVFVLDRELSEVHLLLDNVSANPDTTLVERLAGANGRDELPTDWVEQICRISWPPDGNEDDKAEDAALLIKAKDRLNRLAYPASGSTIAFTLLVTQHDLATLPWLKIGERGVGKEERSPTRNSLAQTAYPDLMPKAIRFRKGMRAISIALVVALFVTCLLSWYVAYGNAALAEYATAQAGFEQAAKRVDEAEAAQFKQTEAVETSAAPSDGALKSAAGPAARGNAAAAAAAAGAASAKFVPYCDGYFSNPTQAQGCNARAEAGANLDRVKRRLAAWICVVSRECIQDVTRYEDVAPPKPGVELTPAAAREAREGLQVASRNAELLANAPSRAAALANIMGTAVLPFLYGLLGAGAAIVRSLSRKIRTSLLSPRDLHLSFQQLALGAVVGACIGLFIAAPGAEGKGLLGPVALSASAISFVAGFGVDSVFEALETLIKRIFNVAQPAAPFRCPAAPAP